MFRARLANIWALIFRLIFGTAADNLARIKCLPIPY
jgi:hypothetical protein